MGFECIWITPVVKSLDYTGYFAEDFFAVDPHLGTKVGFSSPRKACQTGDSKGSLKGASPKGHVSHHRHRGEPRAADDRSTRLLGRQGRGV